MDDGRGRSDKFQFRWIGLISGVAICGAAIADQPEFIEQPIGVTTCGGLSAAFNVRVDFHDGLAPTLRWEFHDGSEFVPLSHGDRGGRVVVFAGSCGFRRDEEFRS